MEVSVGIQIVTTNPDAELHERILTNLLANYKLQVEFVGLELSPAEMVEQKSYQALCEIKNILNNHNLTSSEKCNRIDTLLTLLGTKYDITEK